MQSFNLKSAQLDGSTDLFKYIAKCIANAVRNWHVNGTSEQPLHMEISTSVSGTAGEDVVKLLQDVLDDEGLFIKCNALVNDATMILLAQTYEYGKCEIGAIFDNETNGAYVEDAMNLQTFQRREGQIILSTDWGSFESKTLLRTQFDYHVDRESAHPGEHVFQKLVSASSVGELTRLFLLHYIDCGLPLSPTEHRPPFNRRSSQKLNAKGAIDIKLMWEIDTAKDGIAVQQVLVTKLDLPQDSVSEEDGRVVKEVCRVVLLRAARLSACPIAALLVLMGRASLGGSGVEPGGLIGIAGSLTRPAFQRDMHEALVELIGAPTAKNVLIKARGLTDVNDLGLAVRASLLREKDEMVDLPGIDQANI
jgi:hexokinase